MEKGGGRDLAHPKNWAWGPYGLRSDYAPVMLFRIIFARRIWSLTLDHYRC